MPSPAFFLLRGLSHVLVALLLSFVPAAAWAAGSQETRGEATEPVQLRCHSGSPLLLRIDVTDPDNPYTTLRIEGGGTSIRKDVDRPQSEEAGDATKGANLLVAPFNAPGSYEMEVSLQSEGHAYVAYESTYRVAFVDFVWGRDNFRFGNNRDYESPLGDYSEALGAWLEARFGDVSDATTVLLVHYMYSLFGRNPGRCYAFSAGQYRFWTNPDLLPSYYSSVYAIRTRATRVQREINVLQMDIVFDYFVHGGAARYGPQSVESLRSETHEIMRRIDEGQPVVVGFIGPELHHSMLVYGYIQTPGGDVVDLLVANNWKAQQDNNLQSKNAETVRVALSTDAIGPDGHLLLWRSIDEVRDRQPHRLFVVDVKNEYSHEEGELRTLVAEFRARVRRSGHAVLVVENADAAWLTDAEGATTGYHRGRLYEESAGVQFLRRRRAHAFTVPAEGEYTLTIEDDAGARLFYYSPGTDESQDIAWIAETPAPAEEIERDIPLEAAAPLSTP